MRINADLGKRHYRNGGGFLPHRGSVTAYNHNPREKWDVADRAALILVGLADETGKTVWSEGAVVETVKDMRLDQIGDAGASFILQRGLYTHAPKKGSERETVDETSVRAIILNTDTEREPNKEFEENILNIAQELANDLRQETVIVEFQKRGVTDSVYGVYKD